MKRIIAAACAATLLAGTSIAGAKVGVVDMETIFKSAPQVQQINKTLQKQFDGKKQAIMKQGKALQTAYAKFNKNKSVMSKKDLKAARDSITKQEMGLRKAQGAFQKALFAAQNKAMGAFMKKVNGVVAKLAKKNDMEMVVPKNAVIYADSKLDMTSKVLGQLK